MLQRVQLRLIIFIVFPGLFVLIQINANPTRTHQTGVAVLDFVADFASAKGSKPVSLCHLIRQDQLMGIPLLNRSAGYATSEDRCTSNRYFSFSDRDLAAAQAKGRLPTWIPARPSLTPEQRRPGLISAAAAALFVLVIAVGQFLTRRRDQAVKSDVMAERLLEVLCHAVKSDGVIDDREVAIVAGIAEQLAATRFDDARIRKMIALSILIPNPSRFAQFGEGLTYTQKALMLQGALMVAEADGGVTDREQPFITGLATGLGIPKSQLDSIAAGLRQSSPAAA